MKNPFTDHPSTVGETYFQHMCFASKFAGNLFLAASCCFTHAFLPFLFKKTGSNLVFKMAGKLTSNKRIDPFVGNEDVGI